MNIDDFKNDVSSTAYKNVDGEKRITGKYAQISIMDDEFDIWIITPSFTPISERKLSSLIKKIPDKLPVTRLNGEAWAKCADKDLIRELLPLLGIRKRKVISESEKKRLSNQMKNLKIQKPSAKGLSNTNYSGTNYGSQT